MLLMLIGIVIVYLVFMWVFALTDLPGLHGDEAWFGLTADSYNQQGIKQIFGMNTYTGILQSYFSSVIFTWFGAGILQMRITGVIFNLFSMLILVSAMWKWRLKFSAVILLLGITQSAFFLVSPRVAWEINSFGPFFLVLFFVSIGNLVNDRCRLTQFRVIFFLLINLAGSYNHILFSCLPISCLFGVALWSIARKRSYLNNILILLFFNAINMLVLFLSMRYLSDEMFKHLVIIFCLVSGVLIIEGKAILQVSKLRGQISFKWVNNRNALALLLSFALIFAYFHGLAFYKLITNFTVLFHFFSLRTQGLEQQILICAGVGLLLIAILQLIKDWYAGFQSVWPFIILSYLGFLSLYTTACSFRYYGAIYLTIIIYIGLRFGNKLRAAVPLMAVLLVASVLVGFNVINIYHQKNTILKPGKFSMGHGQVETSAHFLSVKPLITFCRENKISQIKYLSNEYFMEQPILFFNLISPWGKLENSKAVFDYNFKAPGTGFIMIKTKNTE